MKLAEKIWKEIFEELYSRAGFDWWWDGTDEDTAGEINTTIRLIIAAKLEPVRVALSCGVEYLSSLAALTTGKQGEDWDTERDMHLALLEQTLAMLARGKHEASK